MWKTRDMKNAESGGKRGVWWKTRQNINFPHYDENLNCYFKIAMRASILIYFSQQTVWIFVLPFKNITIIDCVD